MVLVAGPQVVDMPLIVVRSCAHVHATNAVVLAVGINASEQGTAGFPTFICFSSWFKPCAGDTLEPFIADSC